MRSILPLAYAVGESHGHGAPQLATVPPLHTVSPAAHSLKPQPEPALPLGQSSKQTAPAAHSTWQFPSMH
jgi:hypothetical protein